MPGYDAVVVGAGPNGLGAAITLARAGRSVLLLEGAATVGGGMRSGEATLPGFIHDECSTIHPLAVSSPLIRRLPLERHGLEWLHAESPMAHPFPDGTAAVLHRDISEMEREFPRDAAAYRAMFAPLARDWRQLTREILQPVVHLPRHPLLLARFGLPSLRSAAGLAASNFRDDRLRALFAGAAAHAVLPLEQPLTASFGIVLTAAAHAVGWPLARGGSQAIADALAAHFVELGGTIETGRPVRTLADLPAHRAVFFDLSPERLLDVCGNALSGRYRGRLATFRRADPVHKVDFALSEPIPWTAAASRTAGTVHLGGTFAEVAASTRRGAGGAPFVIVTQPSIVDSGRAPAGRHVAWAYCRAPAGFRGDPGAAIDERIEQFAPGFRDVVLARRDMGPAQLESRNPNLVGGDITGGSNGGLQLFFRPTLSLNPYRTPSRGVYLCSASTPPGGGVHGMSGYWAARAALRRELR